MESSILSLLSPYGKILRTKVHSLDPKFAPKFSGPIPPSLTAYVEFEKVEEAIAAKDELDMSWDGVGRGRRRIFVNFCSLNLAKWNPLDNKAVHATLTRNERKKEFARMKSILDWTPTPAQLESAESEEAWLSEALNDLVLEQVEQIELKGGEEIAVKNHLLDSMLAAVEMKKIEEIEENGQEEDLEYQERSEIEGGFNYISL